MRLSRLPGGAGVTAVRGWVIDLGRGRRLGSWWFQDGAGWNVMVWRTRWEADAFARSPMLRDCYPMARVVPVSVTARAPRRAG